MSEYEEINHTLTEHKKLMKNEVDSRLKDMHETHKQTSDYMKSINLKILEFKPQIATLNSQVRDLKFANKSITIKLEELQGYVEQLKVSKCSESDFKLAKSEINDQGVQRNLAVMGSWELTATPMVIYRGKNGLVKIVRGRPKDAQSVIGDLENAG